MTNTNLVTKIERLCYPLLVHYCLLSFLLITHLLNLFNHQYLPHILTHKESLSFHHQMAASLSGLSASVTRILFLTGFPKELKTKDIQSAFSDYEGMTGGFKIKWRDDTSLLIVFQDATVGKFNSWAASLSM